jgi:signal transduction histidine kinase
MNETSFLESRNANPVRVTTASTFTPVAGAKTIRVAKVVRDLIKLLCATVPSGIQIRNEVYTQEDWVFGDAAQLQKALLNLATSACPAMQLCGGGIGFVLELEDVDCDLVVEAESAQKFVRLTITATQAVPWETLAQIYEPDKSNPRGLHVVHEIITAHGGSICAESLPGQGTTFIVLLPRAASPVGIKAKAL